MLLGVYLSIERLVLDQQIGTRPLLWLTVLLIMVGTQFFGLGLLGEFLDGAERDEKYAEQARRYPGFAGYEKEDGPHDPGDRAVTRAVRGVERRWVPIRVGRTKLMSLR